MMRSPVPPGSSLNSPRARAAVAGDEHAPAYLILRLETDLTAVLSADGQAIDFRGAEGMQVLHYGALVVRDAADRELPAWIEMFLTSGPRGIRVVFDDLDAVYPVTVNPPLTSPAWPAEGNQRGVLL